VARLGTENGSFQRTLIQHSVLAAVFLDLVMVDCDHFSHCQVDALGHYLASFL
jgi:hypothetical protein